VIEGKERRFAATQFALMSAFGVVVMPAKTCRGSAASAI
jgi:hypothetical protein